MVAWASRGTRHSGRVTGLKDSKVSISFTDMWIFRNSLKKSKG